MDYSNITELDLSNKGLTKLPDLSLYTNLKNLNCSQNQITSMDNLPQAITKLECYNNQITSLDNLPQTITTLCCSNNKLTSLDNLPLTLTELYCFNNQITSLDNLPLTLTELYCSGNPLKYDFTPTLENIRKHTQNTYIKIKN